MGPNKLMYHTFLHPGWNISTNLPVTKVQGTISQTRGSSHSAFSHLYHRNCMSSLLILTYTRNQYSVCGFCFTDLGKPCKKQSWFVHSRNPVSINNSSKLSRTNPWAQLPKISIMNNQEVQLFSKVHSKDSEEELGLSTI